MVCFLIVDTELNVGAGHTKRCLNLAEELRKHLEVSFIVTQVKSIYSKLISRSGFEVQALQKINKQKNSVCIVDGYNFSDEILNYLKENYGKLVYLNDREKFSQIYNIIISNFELKGKQSKRHTLYGNTKYSLVRPLFKNKNIVTRKKIKNLFINFGMKDSFDFTLKTVFL